MTRFNNASFPPLGGWDRRLSEIACPGLSPVETLHDNPWFAVRNRGGYFTIEYHLRQVIVLPIVNHDSIAMVRVNRPVINDMPLELPAGGVKKDENPAHAASRELAEEAGILICDLERYLPMPPIAVFPTRVPNLASVFRVEVSEQEFAERQPHDDEIHRVERISVVDLAKMMATGEIYVSTPLAVLGVFLGSRQIGITHSALCAR